MTEYIAESLQHLTQAAAGVYVPTRAEMRTWALASVADVFVGLGAMNTRIVGAGTVEDLGTGTIIVRLPRPGDRKGAFAAI